MKRKVVITGLGLVSGAGIGAGPLWEALCAGRSAIGTISSFDASGFRSRLAAEARVFESARDYVPKSYRKATKVMARDTEIAVAAAKLAVEDAGVRTRGVLPEGSTEPTTFAPSRMGCHIGAGLIAAEVDELTEAMAGSRTEGDRVDLRAWGTGDGGGGGMNNLPPLWMLKYLPNMLSCHVTIIHGAEGPSNTITCAQASGLLSIGESMRAIQREAADACFSGGAESPINVLRLLRFELAGWLAETGDETDPAKILRPYDGASRGSLLGEAGGILILEEAASAAKRSAGVYAEIAGFGGAQAGPVSADKLALGWSSDGVQYAAEAAMADAGIDPDAIDAIIPQASGVPSMDAGERDALRALFGARLAQIPLVTLAPFLGDTLAAAGGVGAAVGALCLKNQHVPARLWGGSSDGLQAGPTPSRPAELRHILVMTGALGGQCAAIVLRRAT